VIVISSAFSPERVITTGSVEDDDASEGVEESSEETKNEMKARAASMLPSTRYLSSLNENRLKQENGT
jgi:hypothetical protein